MQRREPQAARYSNVDMAPAEQGHRVTRGGRTAAEHRGVRMPVHGRGVRRGRTAGAVRGRVRQERGLRWETLPALLLDGAQRALSWAQGHAAASIALVVAVGLVVTFFGPARSYYRALREGQVLSLKLDEVAALNETIQQQRDSLMTLEGIEDAARRQGYAYKGEQNLVVEGVEPALGTDPTTEGAYEDTRDQPTQVLDFLLGFDPEATWQNA